MIKVKKNPNFKEWFQIFNFDKLIDEVRREAFAFDIAKKETKKKGSHHMEFMGEVVKIKS